MTSYASVAQALNVVNVKNNNVCVKPNWHKQSRYKI